MTTTKKIHARTKTAGYREALEHAARVALGTIAAGSDPLPVLAPMIVMTTALFDRPTDIVMADLSGYLNRGLTA
jgi:hypothetical protein